MIRFQKEKFIFTVNFDFSTDQTAAFASRLLGIGGKAFHKMLYFIGLTKHGEKYHLSLVAHAISLAYCLDTWQVSEKKKKAYSYSLVHHLSKRLLKCLVEGTTEGEAMNQLLKFKTVHCVIISHIYSLF